MSSASLASSLISLLLSSSFALAATKEVSPTDVKTSVLSHFELIDSAEKKSRALTEEALSAEGEFDFKLKVKAANRYDTPYEYQHTEVSVEKRLMSSGLMLYAGHLRGLGDIPDYTGKYETKSDGEAFVGLSVPLLRNRASDNNRYTLFTARLNDERGRAELARDQNTYLHKGLSGYLKWKLSYLKVRVRASLLTLAQERQSMLSRQHQAGDVERLKLVDNNRGIKKRRDELLKAELELQNAATTLSLYYRSESGEPAALAESMPASLEPISYRTPLNEKSAPRFSDQIPQIAILDREMQIARQTITLGASEREPLLNLETTGYRRLDPASGYARDRLQIGVSLEIPLENRKGRGKEESARAKLASLEAQQTYLVRELKASFDRIQQTMSISKQRVDIIQSELADARLIADAERKRWKRGESDLFVVALREQDAADVEYKLLEAEYVRDQAELDAHLLLNDLIP